MSLGAYKIGTGRICSRISTLPRSVPTNCHLLTLAKLGAKKGEENAAIEDVVYANVNTPLQRFKSTQQLVWLIALFAHMQVT